MHLYRRTVGYLVAALLLVSGLGFAEPLKLPEKTPELKITFNKDLGLQDAGTGVAIGELINDFKLQDHQGETLGFYSLLQDSAVMVVFYRGGWCPYCNVQIRQLTEAWKSFQQRKVTPVLISVDRPDAAALAQKTYDIPFPVLADTELQAHLTFNVVKQVGAITYRGLKLKGIDIEAWTEGKHHKIAVPSVFIVSKQGKVLWAHSSEEYSRRPSVKQLLDTIDSLKL